jgi:hypothetical protein
MNSYKVHFELLYPDSDDDYRDAYVLATTFEDAVKKVEKRYKDEYKRGKVLSVELLDSDIIV